MLDALNVNGKYVYIVGDMKVIFLDIDGVLNSITSTCLMKQQLIPYIRYHIDPYNIHFLNIICKEIQDLKIVISSTWRKNTELDEIKDVLYGGGLLPNIEIVGVTPNLHSFRGYEIKKWCIDNEVTSYLILDDDSDMLEEQMKYFIRVDDVTGLTLKDAVKAIGIFDKTNKFYQAVHKTLIDLNCMFCRKKLSEISIEDKHWVLCRNKECLMKPCSPASISLNDAWESFEPKHYKWVK